MFQFSLSVLSFFPPPFSFSFVMVRQDCCICHQKEVSLNISAAYSGPKEAAVGHYEGQKACSTCYAFTQAHKKVRRPQNKIKKVFGNESQRSVE